jgi:hypothetical protein
MWRHNGVERLLPLLGDDDATQTENGVNFRRDEQKMQFPVSASSELSDLTDIVSTEEPTGHDTDKRR